MVCYRSIRRHADRRARILICMIWSDTGPMDNLQTEEFGNMSMCFEHTLRWNQSSQVDVRTYVDYPTYWGSGCYRVRLYCVCVYVCTCVRVYVCTCVRVYVCTCARVHVCTCARVYVCTCVRVYVCTCVCVYVCTCVRV